VWTITTKPFKGAHFAVMPEALVEPCVLAGSREDDIVLDPFTGAATVAVLALRHGRNFIGTELNADYVKIASERIESEGQLFNELIIK
jgi:DNA modification methylase